MSFAVFDEIAGLFFSVFGSGIIFSIILIFFMIVIMITLRANLPVMLMILWPLIGGLVLNTAGSEMFNVAPWVFIVLWIAGGFMFSLFFWIFFR